MMHSRFARPDPGPCPICGQAHTACTPGGPIAVTLLPQRDAAAADVALGTGSDDRPFSTATYRGTTTTRR